MSEESRAFWQASTIKEWSLKEAIDNLAEAVNYFAVMHRLLTAREALMRSEVKSHDLSMWTEGIDTTTPTTSTRASRTTTDYITDSKNYITRSKTRRICYILDFEKTVETPFETIVSELYRYYLVYNRRYVQAGPSDRFARVPSSIMRGKWLSVYSRIVDEAAHEEKEGRLKNHCVAVIVMPDKSIWYMRPTKAKRFVFEYETELLVEWEQEKHGFIPLTKTDIINQTNPFISYR